ncbi:hypothetical protein GCM10009574_024610 [Streptomyces asiaticus]|uniref:Uncharacterized protein n=2 Tax=Streptomyces rhizosphaericus TaxID=114699 RepID=A0ABN1RZL4_9ACTN
MDQSVEGDHSVEGGGRELQGRGVGLAELGLRYELPRPADLLPADVDTGHPVPCGAEHAGDREAGAASQVQHGGGGRDALLEGVEPGPVLGFGGVGLLVVAGERVVPASDHILGIVDVHGRAR